MRTTLVLPDPLHRRAKARAAEMGLSLTAFFRRAIEAAIGGRSKATAEGRERRSALHLPAHPIGLKIDVSNRNYLDLLD